jgi:pullulanase
MRLNHGWRAVFAVSLVAMLASLATAATAPDTLVVHYGRPAGDYDGWTLWVWDDNTEGDSQDLEAVGQDDFGLVFHVARYEYGDGSKIGFLPKLGDWASQDNPDRVWTPDLAKEVWIVSGNPKLFTQEPGEDSMGQETGPVITVHYHRPQGDYSGWTLWTWDDRNEQDSREIAPSETDDYGLVFEVERKNYGVDGVQIGLLPKLGDWASKDGPDRIWFPYMGNEVWILAGNEELFTERPDTTPWVIGAFVDGKRSITVALSTAPRKADLKPENFVLTDQGGSDVPVTEVRQMPPGKSQDYRVSITVGRDLDVRSDTLSDWTVNVKGFRPGKLTIRGILDLPDFYSDKPLGAIYSPDETVFRVFAPTATALTLKLYDQAEGGEAEVHQMKPSDGGTWELTVEGDLKGRYYTLKAEGTDPRFSPDKELIDPYSRCNTAHDGRGMVVDDDTPIAPAPVFDMSEAIIYELHIRDITIAKNSGITHGGKYIGLAEAGTVMPDHPEVKTGIDHIAELGVNVVHVMPIQDFYNDESSDDYNWGYMPVHFDSPDGWYATALHDVTRVKEFKKLVDAFHKKGIKVVMDVVYNHTAEYRPSRVFSFEGLVPGYYYRLKDDGSYWNGSGTGNETRSEAPMMRKFMLESVKYWVEKYDVDGFRFDLLGLTDLETVLMIVDELKAIKPDIIVYGEPWTGGETPITPTTKGMQRGKGFAVFGDHFRDAIKGGVFDLNNGYVQAGINIDKIKRGIEGSINDFTLNPTEAINYVASHDNRTFWDRLVATTSGDRTVTDEDRKRMDRLGAVLVLTSQGIPFMQSGQEMLRTKRGESNTYNKPDAINMINWDWKRENRDIFDYYRGLIALRKAHPMFRMQTGQEVTANLKFFDDDLGIRLPARCVAYSLAGGGSGDSWSEALVILNPNRDAVTVSIPEGAWTVAVDDDEAGTARVSTGPGEASGGEVTVPRISAMVLYR